VSKVYERRSYPRFTADLETEYTSGDSVATVQAVTRTFNISKGGLALSLNRSVPAGRKIHLRIKMPYGSETVDAVGRVVWVKPTARNGVRKRMPAWSSCAWTTRARKS
jgi:hypothetical protein